MQVQVSQLAFLSLEEHLSPTPVVPNTSGLQPPKVGILNLTNPYIGSTAIPLEPNEIYYANTIPGIMSYIYLLKLTK